MKHIPRKRFGQNFLQDQSIIHKIIECINPQPPHFSKLTHSGVSLSLLFSIISISFPYAYFFLLLTIFTFTVSFLKAPGINIG